MKKSKLFPLVVLFLSFFKIQCSNFLEKDFSLLDFNKKIGKHLKKDKSKRNSIINKYDYSFNKMFDLFHEALHEIDQIKFASTMEEAQNSINNLKKLNSKDIPEHYILNKFSKSTKNHDNDQDFLPIIKRINEILNSKNLTLSDFFNYLDNVCLEIIDSRKWN